MKVEEILFNCHCLGDFATEPRNNPAKAYADAVEELASIRSKTTKLGVRQQEKLIELPKLIKELAPFKDQVAISPTAIKRLHRMKREHLYGIKDNLDNKYLQKGLMCETDSIMLVNDVLQKRYLKNKVRKTNDFLTGEADIIEHAKDGIVVPDIKTSWDSQTFDNTINLKKGYYWQVGVGYTWLWEAHKGQVIHCLVNTPPELIVAELNSTLYKFKPQGMTIEEFGFEPEGIKIRTQFFRNHTYSDDGYITNLNGEVEYLKDGYWERLVVEHGLDESYGFRPIPKHERVKVFEFKRNNEDIAFIKSKLEVARTHLGKMIEGKQEVEIIELDKNLCDS